MRRRKPPGGVREALAAEYRYLAVQFDGMDDGWASRFADRIDAGEAVAVRAYEVDLLPPNDMVRIEPDGSIVRLEQEAPMTAIAHNAECRGIR